MSDITVFKRYELKYKITREQKERLLKVMAEYMELDSYGRTTIQNIYYDTPDFRLIRTSLEKPMYKEKLRVRSYGRAGENGKVFVELKKKFDHVVYKRRLSMENRKAESWLSGESSCDVNTQISKEIDYFVKYYGGLVPAMYLCYDRTAYFCKEDPGLRITFDKNILWRTDRARLTSHPNGRQLLEPGQSLMEIKCGTALPLWLVELLNHSISLRSKSLTASL